MAAIVTGCLGAVGGKVGELILGQFKYLYCFRANITNLKNEAEKLNSAQGVISGEVETWLQKSNEIKGEIDGILNEVQNVGSGCFSLGARFSLSKRAEETTDRLKELLGEYKFDTNPISLQRPPASMPIPSEMSYDFDSRKNIEDGIMATLRDGDVNMMGICGMGGLGKTTMARRIKNRALEEHVFQEVAMVVVSRPIDKVKIQDEIAGSLGLKLQGECSEARVQKLHERLSGPKRTLVILDDVWKKLELKGLGIPRGYEGCTILVTSRNRDALSAMSVEKIFGMEVLSEEDSWLLFRMEAGQCVDDTRLNSIAKEVVSECAGLPIVLITVGAALKDVHVSIWENALQRLKINCTPDHIPEYIAEVYNPLKLSYDVLERKYQDVFLLCCLYPEDAHIPLEFLTYFCMGLRLLEGAIRSVEKTRNMIRALTNVLKSRSLLLDSEMGDDYVRMHDVVRDVCIFIAKQEGYIGDNDLTSSLQRYKLHSGFELLQIRDSADKEIKLDGIRDLYVLSIERCSKLTSLPFTQRPNNLITLVLDSCWGLETLSVVGELVNLEILICRDCDSIEELPPEIKGLNRLKVLDLSWCRNLKRIGRGIISSLVGLEELKMLESFKKWEGEDREERENAGLKELGQLTKLRCLEIQIEDLALAAENIRLSSEVDRFTIRFSYQSPWLFYFDKYLSNKKMCLKWEGATCLGDWINKLLRGTECLLLVGNGANEVGVTNLEKIRYLELRECESMKKVVTSSMDKGGATVFPSIENLLLFKLPKLEEICDDRISSNSFQNLKILILFELPVLKQLWKSSQNDLGKDFLPQLEVLSIWYCEMMEGVFLWKGEVANENNSCHHTTKRFPKLKELELNNLPNLISLCQGIEGIEFPLMRKISFRGCWKMKGMVWNEKISGGSSNNASIHGLFCPQQVSFGCVKELEIDWNPFCSNTIHVSQFNGLEELRIIECVGSPGLFTSSVAGYFLSLQVLIIRDCDEMVEVIKDEEEKGTSGDQRALLFPKLHTLQLSYLHNLVSFCELKCDVEFPSLRRVEIRNCPNMKNFTLGSLAAPNLEFFVTDLNNYLLQVPFINLKELSVEWNENPLNCYQIHGSVFDRLEVLHIEGYKGSMSLFSSSITGNLVNLTTLSIEHCDKMVKVIEEKEEEKEKVVSGAQSTTILFPKLQKIKLWRLPELVRFCEWKCDVELPSLTEVVIDDCHNMQSFTLGPLNTPNLEIVKIGVDEFGGVKDLNDIMQQQYINRTKEKQAEEAEKKKGGEEEQERKGEIEE